MTAIFAQLYIQLFRALVVQAVGTVLGNLGLQHTPTELMTILEGCAITLEMLQALRGSGQYLGNGAMGTVTRVSWEGVDYALKVSWQPASLPVAEETGIAFAGSRERNAYMAKVHKSGLACPLASHVSLCLGQHNQSPCVTYTCALLQKSIIPLSHLLSRDWGFCSMGDVLTLLVKHILQGGPGAIPLKYALEYIEDPEKVRH
jgi:hypothetical protein